MAILKHLSVHNSNYHDFITYVLFQHDNHARPIYDEHHIKLLRENVLISALIRGSKTILPNGNTVIMPGDHAIVVTAAGRLRSLDEILETAR